MQLYNNDILDKIEDLQYSYVGSEEMYDSEGIYKEAYCSLESEISSLYWFLRLIISKVMFCFIVEILQKKNHKP